MGGMLLFDGGGSCWLVVVKGGVGERVGEGMVAWVSLAG